MSPSAVEGSVTTRDARTPLRVDPRPRWPEELNPLVVLAGIVLLAAAVRLMAIGSRLHVDDAYTWLVASQPGAHAFLRQLAATENTPLLSYLLLTPLPIDHPAWLRAPAAVCGVLMCVALYYGLRRPLGARVSLLAALVLAVSPYLISYSDLARGFMLEDVELLVALWAVIELVERPSTKWLVILFVAGTAALYTEYSAAIFLVALTVGALLIGRPRPWRIAWVTGLTFVPLVAWIPEIVRAERQVGVTKLHPQFSTPSFTQLRDAAVKLAIGEHGGTTSSAGRWLEFVVILAVAGAATVALRGGFARMSGSARRTVLLIAITAGLTLVGHAIAPAVGVDVFTQRYMTILIPLGAALGAAALVATGRQALLSAAVVLLLGLGVAGLVRRDHGQYEPDFQPVRVAAIAMHPRSVLTNTPLVSFYLRSLRPQFDRPSNLGPGRAGSCARPCLIIDDSRVYTGTPRRAAGTHTAIGPYVLTLER